MVLLVYVGLHLDYGELGRILWDFMVNRGVCTYVVRWNHFTTLPVFHSLTSKLLFEGIVAVEWWPSGLGLLGLPYNR